MKDSTLDLFGCNFKDCTSVGSSDGRGGAISVFRYAKLGALAQQSRTAIGSSVHSTGRCDVYMTASNFERCASLNAGGGFYLVESEATISHTSFRNCTSRVGEQKRYFRAYLAFRGWYLHCYTIPRERSLSGGALRLGVASQQSVGVGRYPQPP